jgi:hypothetical protein
MDSLSTPRDGCCCVWCGHGPADLRAVADILPEKKNIFTNTLQPVIDPTIHFGWIAVNWSEPDQAKARAIILEQIGHSLFLNEMYSIYQNNSQPKAYLHENTESAGSPAGSGSGPSVQPVPKRRSWTVTSATLFCRELPLI